MTTRAEREQLLEAAKLNVFKLRAEDVLLDWLTDSGTGAMSTPPVGRHHGGRRELRRAPAASTGWRRCSRTSPACSTSSPPTRAAPPRRCSSRAVCKKGDLVPNNCHFDTTRANLEFNGVEAVDLVIPEGLQPGTDPPLQGQHRPGPRGGRC